MPTKSRSARAAVVNNSLPPLRYPVREAAGVLRMSIAQTWKRIWSGELRTVRDGKRRYVTHEEIVRYSRASHES